MASQTVGRSGSVQATRWRRWAGIVSQSPASRAVGEWKSARGCPRFADFDYALNKDSWTSPCASRSEKREDRDKRSGFEPIARPHYSVAALVAAVLRRDSDLTARFESQGAGRRFRFG